MDFGNPSASASRYMTALAEYHLLFGYRGESQKMQCQIWSHLSRRRTALAAALLAPLLLFVFCASAQAPHPLTPAEKQRVDELVKSMSLHQKLDYIGGTGVAARPVQIGSCSAQAPRPHIRLLRLRNSASMSWLNRCRCIKSLITSGELGSQPVLFRSDRVLRKRPGPTSAYSG